MFERSYLAEMFIWTKVCIFNAWKSRTYCISHSSSFSIYQIAGMSHLFFPPMREEEYWWVMNTLHIFIRAQHKATQHGCAFNKDKFGKFALINYSQVLTFICLVQEGPRAAFSPMYFFKKNNTYLWFIVHCWSSLPSLLKWFKTWK